MSNVNVSNIPEFAGQDINLKTATDISTKQYFFVKNSSGNVVVAGAGEQGLGVLQNAPVGTTARAAIAQVRTVGMSKVKLGGTVSAGQYIKSDSNGKGVAATTDKDIYMAKALTDGVDGDIIATVVCFGTVSV